ncbi:hypothetical protein D3C71_1878760 [compost metagenome]
MFENLRGGASLLRHPVCPPLAHADTMSVAVGCNQHLAVLALPGELARTQAQLLSHFPSREHNPSDRDLFDSMSGGQREHYRL